MLYIFDIGGVVTSTFDYNQVFDRLGVTSDDFFSICKTESRNLWDELQCGWISNDEFWSVFQRTSGIKIDYDYFRLLFHPVMIEGIEDLIKDLKKREPSCRVVAGTNTIQSHYEIHIERGDYALFDSTYASNKIHLAKPSTDFFKVILDAEGVKPCDAFFTDDKAGNCLSAESLGIKTYCFDNVSELRKKLGF
ncbi:MAG: HAD hydrolase-like protein [Treponema sp.]|nr:HAD hydrolase-like protein [Treponema sp.]